MAARQGAAGQGLPASGDSPGPSATQLAALHSGQPAATPVRERAAEPPSEPAAAGTVPQHDPLVEAPEALWYVRTTGAEYGPATSHVMRGWIAEGRISSEALVWRQGWPDWKLAGSVFADVLQAPEPAAPGELIIDPRARRGSKAKSASAVTLVIILCIASVVLLGALIYVITVVN